MTDLLETSSAWLDDQRRRFLSRTVTYSRGDTSAEVLVTVGRTIFDVTDAGGFVQQWQSRDFLIATADLAAFGLPERGDRITETQGEQSFVYEVMAPAGETPWRWSNPYRKTLRIHTKQVSES